MIKGVKLTNGEDLFAEVREESEYSVLSKPYRPIVTQEGLQLIPWLLFAKNEEFKIKNSQITLTYDLIPQIENAYRQQTSGIVTAPAGALNQLNRLQI